MNGCKSEFSLEHLTLRHNNPHLFVTSQWQKQCSGSLIYVVYRWAVAIYFIITLILCYAEDWDKPFSYQVKFFLYFTNWAYIISAFQAIVVADLTTRVYRRLRKKSRLNAVNLKCYKLYWLSNFLSTDIAFLVTIWYWGFIYNPKLDVLNLANIFRHATNSVVTMVDLYVVAHPVRLLHGIYTAVFLVIYGLFTAAYYVCGGRDKNGYPYMYKFLDWRKPWCTFGICMGFVVVVNMLHSVVWLLYQLRKWIHLKYCTPEEDDTHGRNATEDDAEGKLLNSKVNFNLKVV
ncbi:hypothetical protein Zmor_015286 [Zophobas morio]|uniref:Protein rolling stone n=1 Tax=Zophobas morio TaxID=2755281 RepID=A0AA38IGT1_9CUCU|nr:hypothetical protein Zmor_015286 [Zophobas morio]